MATLFDDGDRARLMTRFGRVDPARPPIWGSLSAPRMLSHVGAALRMGLGELQGDPGPALLRWWPVNRLMMHVLPWPKGAPVSTQLLPEAAAWEAEVRALEEVVARFVAHRGAGYARHATFGTISTEDWGRLMHRHMDWHLRQFGA